MTPALRALLDDLEAERHALPAPQPHRADPVQVGGGWAGLCAAADEGDGWELRHGRRHLRPVTA